ncbi:hypothetical protein VTN77DRAFT_2483 [Rasamsonia byssochlamydoides]|uniref:uncharacterized protein n=1 Tax=Rasamsonia byssochlamydoides TaxID=89139 RepID=UPI0037435000
MAKSSPLQVTVLPATQADCLTLAQIESIAFHSTSNHNNGNNSSADDSGRPSTLARVMFGPPTAEGHAFRAKDLAEKMQTDPSLRVFKAVVNVDARKEEQHKIVAWAGWHYYFDPQPIEEWQDKEWPGSWSPQACNDFFGTIARKRNQYMGEKRYALLEVLVTLPAYQGLGIGSRLLQAGLDQAADQHGLSDAWLEASVEGYALYRKFGFRDVDEILMDLTRYGGTGSTRHVCMLRSAD